MKRQLLILLFCCAPALLAQGLPHGSASETGFSPERLDRLRANVQSMVDAGEFAGVNTLVARHGKIAFAESIGYKDAEAKTPLTPDAIFYIFSMTKLVASTTAMIAYEDGKFLLDDPVSKYIPEFANVTVLAGDGSDPAKTVPPNQPVTIHHLLTHTAGLTNGAAYRELGIAFNQGTIGENAVKLTKAPLTHQPGEAWRYGDYALDTMNHLIEIWYDMPYEQFLQERLLQPLGMVDTGYWVPEEKWDRVVKAYRINRESGLAEPDPNPFDVRQRTTFFGGGYGLFTTMGDYVRLGQMLLNGGELDGVRILGKPTVDFMMRNHVPLNVLPPNGPNGRKGHGYGIGGAILMDPAQFEVTSHEGDMTWAGAAGGFWWIDREADLVGVWLVQRRPWVTGPSMKYRVQVYQAMEN